MIARRRLPAGRRWRFVISALTWMAVLGCAPLRADPPPSPLAEHVTAYRYRPDLFADQKLRAGLVDTAQALQGALWYIRMGEYDRAAFGMDRLAGFVQDQQIPGLDFTGHRTLTDADLERLFQFQLWPASAEAAGYRFRLLKLAGTQTTDRALATIGRLFNLQVLELNGQMTDNGLSFLSRLGNLKVLSLAGAPISDQGLSAVSALRGLRSLDLKGTLVTDAGMTALLPLPLRHLSVGPRVTDAGIRTLSGLQTLEQLDASQARVGASGLSALSGIRGIHTLFLGRSMTDQGLSALQRFKNLKRLDLTGARLSDASAGVWEKMPGLQELALDHSQVGDATLRALSRLPALRYLEVSDTRVTPASFGSMNGFAALEALSLSSRRRLTTADLASLARFPKLHTILINGAPVGRPIIDYLRQKRRDRSWLDELVPWAEAADVSDKDVDQALDAAAPDADAKHPFSVAQGLPRIHDAENALDEVVPAMSNPDADTVQENKDNFLGEFTVGVQAPSKKKS